MSARKVNVRFMKIGSVELVRNIENVLPVFDDSCKDINNDKKFVSLATAARHRAIDLLYVKYDMFHQSRWSRTIDLNTSDIILFNYLVMFSN